MEEEKLEVIAEEQPLKGRALMRRKLSEMHPDQYGDDYQWPDEEDTDIEAYMEYANGLGERNKSMTEVSQRLADGIKKNPAMADVFLEIIEGRNPMSAIVRAYGKDMLSMDPDSEDFKEIVAAEDERARKMAEDMERTAKSDEEFQDNLDASNAVFEEFAKEKGMDENAFKEFFQSVYDLFATPIFQGLYTKDFLERVYKAINYDGDIEQAIEAGEVQGKNAKIVEGKKRKVGDGIPSFQGSGAQVAPEQPREAPRRRSIWDKG